jgi:hypothetical protein
MSVIDDVTEPLMSKFQGPRSSGDAAASLCECFGNYSPLKLPHSFIKGFLFGEGSANSKHLERLAVYAVFL